MLRTEYSSLAVDGLQKPLKEIKNACETLGINFFIVGAIARNIWFVTNDKNPTGTKDIDFGVFVPDVLIYNQLRSFLIKNYAYTALKENAFCLFSSEGIQIDLLPFGDIEKEGIIKVDGVGVTSIKLDGFKEVYLNGSLDVEIGAQQYKACSIPGIVIIKNDCLR